MFATRHRYDVSRMTLLHRLQPAGLPFAASPSTVTLNTPYRGPAERDHLASVSPSRWRRTRCQRFRVACWGDALGTTGLGMPDVPVTRQQVLQFIREVGYLTGGLSYLLDRLLCQGCIFGVSLYHLPELDRPELTVILAMKSVMVMRR